MNPSDSSSGVVWALPTTNSPARSTMKVSVIVPPASIASTRGSRPFERPPAGASPAIDAYSNSKGRPWTNYRWPPADGGPTIFKMRGALGVLAAALAAMLLLPAMAPSAASAAPRRAIVLLAPTPPSAAVARASATAVLARNGLRRARPDVPQVGVMTVDVPAGASFGKFAARLERDPSVRRVEPDSTHRLRFIPNDPALTLQDPLATRGTPYQWYLAREGFPAAWDVTRAAGIKVGIIDSGIDGTHPDLSGKIAAARDQDAGGGGTADDVGHGTH